MNTVKPVTETVTQFFSNNGNPYGDLAELLYTIGIGSSANINWARTSIVLGITVVED